MHQDIWVSNSRVPVGLSRWPPRVPADEHPTDVLGEQHQSQPDISGILCLKISLVGRKEAPSFLLDVRK
ncbi:hypothetical protein JTE90_011769 [Oedothorax gibbosus]|uniref:Uncharacterized protein n=1 Tax=Oedothorax gibbosus TaxID=931172 RepID=A0AAV6VV16_9ARAC|nr:hypothetical protein JTE90_011769 [Oedothorax gibbosus]